MLPKIFFGYFAVVIVLLSVLVITRRNPVHSILWMLLLFVHIAALYLFLNAEFLAAIQIIVYAGAILVLFLFVVMLLNLRREEIERRAHKYWLPGALIGVILLTALITVLAEIIVIPPLGRFSVEAVRAEGNMMSIGKVLYTQYLLPFEIASVVLLVAIIGAVVLVKKKLE